jgi:hypothetical protein
MTAVAPLAKATASFAPVEEKATSYAEEGPEYVLTRDPSAVDHTFTALSAPAVARYSPSGLKDKEYTKAV